MMKRVLLLSCSTGQGHNSCAEAVKEYFEEQHVVCEIYDSLKFIGEKFARFMSWGHSFMYRHIPGLFRWGYRYSEDHPNVFKPDSCIYKLLTAGAEHLYDYIVDGHYDTVICTHIFSAVILTHSLKHHKLAVNTAFVATDYTCYPGMEASDLQTYFVADKSLIEPYAKRGIPAQRIYAAGIPVRKSFFQNTAREDAKVFLDIDRNSPHLLIMCGSMGCGPIKTILRHIAKALPDRAEVSVICGTNKRLYRILNYRYRKSSRIHIVGYTDKVSLYMDSADLYLTKPGGISVTEAAVKQRPMLFINAVAGCEQYNMDFFLRIHSAVTERKPKRLAQKSIHLLRSEGDRQYMEERLREQHRPDGAAQIYAELSRCSNKISATKIS